MLYRLLRKFLWFIRRIIFRKHSKRSKGEKLVYNWLKENKFKFKEQYFVVLPEVARNTHCVFIDFMVYVGDNVYAIEYNGRQHYEYTPFFHKNGHDDFEKQVRRDVLVEKWCIENGYKFLEIPYYLSKYQVKEFLKTHLI